MGERAASRPRPLHDLAAAVGFLTLLPVGRKWGEERPRSAGYYPWVGWLLGGAAALALVGAVRAAGHAPRSGSLLAGALVVAGWAFLTRLLHWDGLADTADGLWGAPEPSRRLEIMRDSRVGSFGSAAVALTAIVHVAAAAYVVSQSRWWVLVAAPVLARAGASAAGWTLPHAREDGLGSLGGRPGPYDLIAWTLGTASLGLLVVLGAPARPLATTCMVGLGGAILIPGSLSRPVGGVTGDILGASILLTEALVLAIGGIAW